MAELTRYLVRVTGDTGSFVDVFWAKTVWSALKAAKRKWRFPYSISLVYGTL